MKKTVSSWRLGAKSTLGSLALLSALSASMLAGCNSNSTNSGGSGSASTGADTPSFSLAWSEYPSWSIFGVADQQGLIDGAAGAMGSIEEKWNVDIVLNFAEYDPCITQYGTNTADAVCITNMDILSPSLKRASVAIMPTSTSVGADACIAVGIDSIDDLAGKTTYGLEKSVSQYCFERVLEESGKDPEDYPFSNQDPGVAAMAMQASQAGTESIMVWNPFVMQTLKKRTDSKVLFDSSTIPEEIIDMVVVGKDSLSKPGGKRFAYAILDTFYAVNGLIADSATSDEALIALGEKFGGLGLEEMKQIIVQTRMYTSAKDGLALFDGDQFSSTTMPKVVEFCVSHEICDAAPEIAFGDASAMLNFDSRFLKGIAEGISPDSVE